MTPQRITEPYPSPRWQGWAEDAHAVAGYVDELIQGRFVWNSYLKRLRLAPREANNAFHKWFARNYCYATATTLRLLADVNPRRGQTRSLLILLDDLRQNTTELTLANFQVVNGATDPQQQRQAQQLFAQLAEGVDPVAGAMIDRDIKKALDAVKPIKGYVDQKVAHFDRSPVSATNPEIAALSSALDCMVEVHDRYFYLLNGYSLQLTRQPMPTACDRALQRLFGK